MATTADDVWRILGELAEAQKETERLIKEQAQENQRRSEESQRRFEESQRRFEETERVLKEQTQETERLLKEQTQETERVLKAQSEETDRQLQAAIQENKRVNRQVSKQLAELGGAWGRFVEDLVAPACERLFVERGIPVNQVSQRVKRRRQGETMEVDVLVVNQGHVLAVEVKSRLNVEDVKAFIQDLGQFRDFFPEYAQMTIYGAVAGIGIEAEADRYAYRQGLFVLAQSGETVEILNDAQFQPRVW
jgi:hypothetical protein